MGSLRRYAALLRLPGALRALVPALLARSTYAMAGLALVLLVHARTGSFARAGAVAATFSLAAAAASPLLGRAVDRAHGPAVLVAAGLLFPALLLTQLVVPARGVLSLLAAGAAGLAEPPTGPAMRALWPDLSPDPVLVAVAYNFESVLVETVFVVGPLLVGLLTAVAGPAAALAAAAAAMSLGTLGFATAPAVRRRHHLPRAAGSAALPAALPAARAAVRAGSPLRARGVRAVLVVVALVAGSFGVLEVAIPGFATAHGSPARSGLLLALWAAGSFTGGLWYGGRHWSAPPVRRYLRLVPLIGLTLLPLAAARTVAELAVLLFLTGVTVAPTGTEEFALVAAHAPAGTGTETFTFVSMLMGLGSSAGNALGGWLLTGEGTSAAFLAAAGLALAGGAAAVASRGWLALPALGKPPAGIQEAAR